MIATLTASCATASSGISKPKASLAVTRTINGIHRASSVLRMSPWRVTCKSAQANYASTLLPDSEISELEGTYPVSYYDTEWAWDYVNKCSIQVDPISKNKKKLQDALKAYEARPTVQVNDFWWQARKALMLAMAMQESNHMDVRQRDTGKDNDPMKANHSLFNLNGDLIARTGYFVGGPGHREDLTMLAMHCSWLDSDEGLTDAVGVLECAFGQWGIQNTLAFVRQGRSGFDPDKATSWREFLHYDGFVGPKAENQSGDTTVVYNVCQYLRCIKKYLRYIDQPLSLNAGPALFENAYRPDIPCPHI